MSTENSLQEDKYCPLCGANNGCKVADGDCWCFHKKVPAALRERIPVELRGKSCICEKCVDEYYTNHISIE